MPCFSTADLTDFAAALFAAEGVLPDEARQVAESLVEANLDGHDSHGVMRIPSYLAMVRRGELVSGAPLCVLRETPAMLWCDASCGFGQVQMRRLCDLVLKKAQDIGSATVAAQRCGHVGRLAEWTGRLAEAGAAALLAVNDNGLLRTVAPPGGLDPCISTNPISLAVPRRDESLVLDISTSVVASGKVALRRYEHEPCPPGWLQDAQGNPTVDPAVLEADPPGSLLPLGGIAAHKGFGLGLLLDMLVAGLSGGFCPPAQRGAHDGNNVLLVAWWPDHFAGTEHLRREAEKLAAAVRASRRCPQVAEIQLPGDRSRQTRLQRQSHGIPLGDGVWNKLCALAAKHRLAPPASLDAASPENQ